MNHRLLITLLAALSMLGALCIDAFLPSLPFIAKDFDVSLSAVQQALTIYLFAFALMSLFYGTLSDSFGRRSVLLASMYLYVVGSVGAIFAPSLGWLLFFRFLQGLSAGAGPVIGKAIVGDFLTGAEAQRTLSYISVVFGLAPAIAPILGGWLQVAFGWRSVFVFIALFGVVLLVACQRFLKETLVPEKRHAFHFRVIVANYWQVARHARFLLQSLSIALTFFGIMLYVAAAPAYVIGLLHLSVTQFAWLFIPLIGGIVLGSVAAGRLSHSLSPAATIRAGFLIMIVGAAANALYAGCFAIRVPWAVLPIFVYSFGAALASPAMTVIVLELLPRVRGLASSLQTFMFMVIFTLCSGVVCPLLFGSAFHLSLGLLGGVALSMACWGIARAFPESGGEAEAGQPFGAG